MRIVAPMPQAKGPKRFRRMAARKADVRNKAGAVLFGVLSNEPVLRKGLPNTLSSRSSARPVLLSRFGDQHERPDMRPFFPYYGSTWNRARYLPAPVHPIVRERFAGGAGYSLFYACPRVELTDKDPVIVGLWSWLIRATAAEIMALPELPEVGDSVDNYAIPQEAKWLIGFWLNRGSAQPKKSRTAYSNWGLKAKERIAAQLPILAGWSVREGGYEEGPTDECTWLIDPPYEDKGRYYRMKFDGHTSLGKWCKALPGQVIVLEGAGADWLPFRSLGYFKTSLGKSEEKVWVSGSRAPAEQTSLAI